MQSLALDKRGTCTCTGRVTAQGNKDTMTTMVVVIVDDGDHHLDHDETLGGGLNCTKLKGMGAR